MFVFYFIILVHFFSIYPTSDPRVSKALRVTRAILVRREKKEIKVTSDLKAKGAKQVCKVNKEYRVFKVKKAT